jgi:MOSC domain-containing protein YiiM
MKVVSVNVGRPQQFTWKGMAISTAIFKQPVEGLVAVRKLNLDGDQQADLTVHGGTHKAVYGYAAEHYAYWRSELPEQTFPWGAFGENLTTEGLSEDSLFIGDRLKVGSAQLIVTQPRLPCYKLTLRFDRDDVIKRFLKSHRSGLYFSVVQEGEVSAGSPIEIISRDPNQVTIADISRLYFNEKPDAEVLSRALKATALPLSWREELSLRAQTTRR